MHIDQPTFAHWNREGNGAAHTKSFRLFSLITYSQALKSIKNGGGNKGTHFIAKWDKS